MTATQQRNAVSEGVAYGLVMLERCEIPYNKFRADRAFEDAWRNWPDRYRSKFPHVSNDIAKGLNGSLVLTHVTERKQTFLFYFYWERGGTLNVWARRDWDSDDPSDAELSETILGDIVPLSAWVGAGEQFH